MSSPRCRSWLNPQPLFLSMMLCVAAGSAAPDTAIAQPVSTPVTNSPGTDVNVDPGLIARLQSRSTASMLVYFHERPDLTPAFSMDWQSRGRFVHEQLSQAADNAQESLRAHLDAHGIDYKTFWIDNVIYIPEGSQALLDTLTDASRFSGIRAILGEQEVLLIEPELMVEDTSPRNAAVANIEHVKATDVWELGFTGRGMVVGAIDTGVRHTHTSLVSSYRGTIGPGQYSHAYNWWDPYTHSPTPFDTHNHGSHVTGVMSGNGGENNRIGMAPDAQWIHCQGFNPAGNNSQILECGEFMAAPWDLAGENPDPDQRPHVVNNSWSNCQQLNNPWYEGVIDTWIAAGIVPIFANGNNSNCQYARPPGLNTVGNPARSGKVISVGSTGLDNGLYASHSNWGPTDDPALGLPLYPDHFGFPHIKPNVVAPGVSIRSAGRASDNDYYLSNGTSMSAPHVAGLVALMWEAAPCLIGDHASTGTLIMQTVNPVPYATGGSPAVGPNNVPNYATGWGEIDAVAAVTAAIQSCGGFTIDSVPSSARMCAATQTTFALRTRRHGDFDDPVTFTVDSGLPATLDAAFAPNPVVPGDPPAITTLTISAPAGHTDGQYVVTVRAASAGPGHDPESKTRQVRLRVDAAPIVAPSPTVPANGALDIEVRPEFQWSGIAGESYRLQIATDAVFTAPVLDQAVNNTRLRVGAPLNTGTTYYWRVRGENSCGDGDWSPTHSFQTLVKPVAQVTPSALHFLFTQEESRSQALTVTNAGTADLVWTLDETNLSGAGEDIRGGSGESWSFIGPSGGDVKAVGISPMDPDVMFAGLLPSTPGNGKLYRSTDGGDNWTLSFDSNGVYDIDFASDGTVYLGTHKGIRKSTDNGVSWTTPVLGIGPVEEARVITVAPGNPAIIYAGINDATGGQPINLIRSTNAGQTWQNVTPPLSAPTNGYAVAIDPTDSNVVIAAFAGTSGGGSVWVSVNGGNTWSNRSAGLPNRPARDLHYDGNRLLLGGGQAFGTQYFGLYESYDLGVTWAEIPIAAEPPMIEKIAVNPLDPNQIYVATDRSGVHRSLDGGTTWQTGIGGTGSMSTRSIAFVPGYSDELVLGALAHGVLKTSNGGDTFVSHGHGISEITLFSAHVNPLNADEIAVAFQAQNTGGVYTTVDGGGSWTLEATPAAQFTDVRFDYEGTLHGLTLGPATVATQGLWRRGSNGAWTYLGPDQTIGSPANVQNLQRIVFGRNNPDLILLAGRDLGVQGTEGTVWRSADRGATWTKVVEVGSSAQVTTLHIIEDGTDLNILAAWGHAAGGEVIRSSDGGVTWSNASVGLPTTITYNNTRLCAHPRTPQRVFLSHGTTTETRIYRSDDAGANWVHTGASIPGVTFALVCDPMDEAVLYTSHNRPGVVPMVQRSTDYGTTFVPYVTNLPESVRQPRGLTMRGDSELIVATAQGSFLTSLGGEARACRSPQDIPWLSVSPDSGTTQPGHAESVSISVDSTGLPLGQHRAQLCLNSNDPDNALIRVPVDVTVADAQFGGLAGEITAIGQCGQDPALSANTEVTITGQFNTFTLTTDANGRFNTSLDISESPLTVRAHRANYLDAEQGNILLSPAGTVQLDLEIRLDAACATATPAALTLEAVSGHDASTILRIDNTAGAGALDWTLVTATPTLGDAGRVAVSSTVPLGVPLDAASLASIDLPSIAALDVIAGTINCAGPGVIINDDGTPEVASSASPDAVQVVSMVDYFVPENYPARLDAMCFVILSQGPTSINMEVVVYDDDAPEGGPGTELGVLPITLNNLPVFPPLPNPIPWFAIDLSALDLRIQSGGVYLGLRWVPSIPNVLLTVDTSEGNPPGVGGGYRKFDDLSWRPIGESTPGYRAMLMRAVTTDVSGCDAPGDVDWLEVSLGSGQTTAGGWTDITVSADSSSLALGRHEASLCLESNDPTRPLIVVPVAFEVTADPANPVSLVVLSGSGQSATVGIPFDTALAVSVVNGHGQPVAGVDIAFNAPVSGAGAALSAHTVVTDANGYAAVTAVANGIVGSYAVSAEANGLPPVVFALNNLEARADLAIDVHTLREYARPGQLLDYLVTIRNLGPDPAHQASVSGLLAEQLDVGFGAWQCLGPAESGCTASGNGHLHDDGLTMVPGGSLSYLLSAPVLAQADGVAVTSGAVVHALDGNPANNHAQASTVLVIHRNGFEAYGDGSNLSMLDRALTHDDAIVLVSASPAIVGLHTVLLAFADGQPATANDAEFRIEQLDHAHGRWLRAVSADESGHEYAAQWLPLADDGRWQLAILDSNGIDDPGEVQRHLQLRSGNHQILLPLLTRPASYRLQSYAVLDTDSDH